MKPRKRAQQSQSSRLHLRKKDHRDVIYNGNFHNILYASKIPKDPDKPDKDLQTGVFWKKYPKMVLMDRVSQFESYYGYHIWPLYIDIDRQLVGNGSHNGFGIGGQRTGYYHKLRDIWLVSSVGPYSGDESRIYKTDDGVEYVEGIKGFAESVKATGVRYGANNLITVSKPSTYMLEFTVQFFEEDSDGNLELDHVVTSRESYGNANEYKYLGPTNTGALFLVYRTYDGAISYLIEVFGDYAETRLIETTTPSSITSINQVLWCRKGSILVIAFVYSTSGWHYHTAVWTTTDNGQTFTKQGMLELDIDRDVSDNDAIRLKLVERNGWFYLYGVVKGGKLYGWKSSTGLEWTSINLPDYLDVPMINSGNFVMWDVPEKYRLVMDPSKDPGDYAYTLTAWTFIASGEYFCFIDGEHATIRDYTEKEYLYLYTGDGYTFYIDNMIFLNSDKNFGFRAGTTGVQSDQPDPVIEGDYTGGWYTQLDPNENFGEDMYVWDDENQRYLLLDQSRLDWNDYPGYQILEFDELPEVGQTGIVYVVPRKYKPSKIVQYIWNPYENKFELLENASYDLSPYTFSSKEVAYLPTTGEVGIIYLVPRENIDPPEEETFITWIEYIWSEDNQIFMQPEELGMSWIDFMDYEYLYMVSLPETGVAHKLYLIPDNAPPTPEPEEEEV